ncbi:hypothetical protein LQE92_11920 [Lacrimispora sp. NSJ-141]|uniref:Uncharacterized protein n=1 Tax=Lientehia hominis TaxID=2897778 RepID=A0AAP2RK10_9FIRM|nr:hypothetical protein [Lientehia hominis]MCD2493321.1 hypothetical protein [Lientehia hominis]
MQEKVIKEVLQRMGAELSQEQMQSLESVLALTLHQYHLEEMDHELIVSENGWERILRTSLAAKRLENCAQGTLEQYNRAIRIMMGTIQKRLQDYVGHSDPKTATMYRNKREASIRAKFDRRIA